MRSKLPLGRLAVELVVIIAGVLTALAVDEWAAGREHRALADEVLQALGAELTANLGQLERRIAYHEEVRPGLDSLQRLAEAGQRLDLVNSDVLPQGLGFALLRNTAWETALITEAVRWLDLPTTTLLSTTYALQDALGESEDAISDGIVRPEWLGASDQGGAAIFLAVLVRDLVDQERELASFTRAAIDHIRDRLGEDVSLDSPIEVSDAGPRGPARGPASPPRRVAAPPAVREPAPTRSLPAGG